MTANQTRLVGLIKTYEHTKHSWFEYHNSEDKANTRNKNKNNRDQSKSKLTFVHSSGILLLCDYKDIKKSSD